MQFPELVATLGVWGRRLERPRRPRRRDRRARSQGPAGRVSAAPEPHPRPRPRLSVVEAAAATRTSSRPRSSPFDLLRDDDVDLRALPLTERRAHARTLFARTRPRRTALRLSEQVAGDGRALYARAQAEGWEGLLVKRAQVGLPRRPAQPRMAEAEDQPAGRVRHRRVDRAARARATISARLILGRYDEAGRLVHAGDVGTGFNGAELESALEAAETACDGDLAVSTTSRRRWAGRTGSKPQLVAQVRYTEITDDGRLRHPAYLGLRDDKVAHEVMSPAKPPAAEPSARRSTPRADGASAKPSAEEAPRRRARRAIRSRRGHRSRSTDRAARRLRARARRTGSCSCRTATRSTSPTCRRSSGPARSTRRAICFATTRASRRCSCR